MGLRTIELKLLRRNPIGAEVRLTIVSLSQLLFLILNSSQLYQFLPKLLNLLNNICFPLDLKHLILILLWC